MTDDGPRGERHQRQMKIQVLLEAESNLALTCQLRLIYCLTEPEGEYLLNNFENQITQRMRCFALLDFWLSESP